MYINVWKGYNMGFYYDGYIKGIREEEKKKKEQDLQQELSSLRSEIKRLKKVNTREEVTLKIKSILLTDGILEDKTKEIVDYFMYLLERESK